MSESYIPTKEERLAYKTRREFLSVSGDGVFATLQGEGVTAGYPAVFLRLQDCNLHCGRNGIGWRCDAWYTWDEETPEFWQERNNQQTSNIAIQIENTWDGSFGDLGESERRLVVTGGEPLLQQDKIIALINELGDGWNFEIETNGTIAPKEELDGCQINCSPKLASSGNTLRARYKPEVLRHISEMPNSWFKFVISSMDDEKEVECILNECNISPDRVLLMPEGVTRESLESKISTIELLAAKIGALAVQRNHIFWFGDKRRT